MPLLPADLPLLLAGPILRRVESDLVSVWIATARPCDVALLLFDGANVRASQTADDDRRAKWVSVPQPTLQVGANLHVLTVVLDLRAPGGNASRADGATLDDDRAYSYDLQIFERGNPTPHTFRSQRLLERPFPLGYEPDDLPSFSTCPRTLDRLVVVHGSCRQLFSVPPLADDPDEDDDPFQPPLIRNPDPPAPAERHWPLERPSPESPLYSGDEDVLPDSEYPNFPKRDGMVWIDALIEARGPSPLVQRPHQLFLTGDQIYADQPSTVLLPVLNALAGLLIGGEYVGASPADETYRTATLENFPPGFRGSIVRRSAGFTTSAGDSHLLSFGEFVAYYLLTWSPALWDLGDKLWPETFVPTALAMPEDWRARFIHESDQPDAATTAAFDTLVDNLPDGGPAATDDPDAIARFYFEQQRKWMTEKYWSPELFEWWHRRFRAELPRVRRALANVPTYMLADDHDISDDWYFSRQWREQVFTRPLGVDVLRNGMMALSLMQSWGNDPRRWATGPEAELLQECASYARVMSAAVTSGQDLVRSTLDRLHELLGLPQTVTTTPAPTFRPLVEYSYRVESPCHRALVVDGRTKRRFPFRTSQAGGIDFEGATGRINPELPTGLPGEDASGLFGDSPMAAALPPRPALDTKLTLVVTGVPLLGPEGMELALLPFQRLARLMIDVDAEAWSYEPSTYEAMLAALARYGSVVVLSGDLHIGYSAALDYWSRPTGGAVTTARVVQLVSSGLTKDWGDMSPALRGHPLSLDVFESATNPALMNAERIGWGTPLRTELTPPEPLGTLVTQANRAHPSYRARLKMRAPVLPTHGWPEGTTEAQEPNWAWRAVMARDERPEDADRPPSIELRWTPVELPTDPVDPNRIGWHTRAVRRMAFGRVFAVNPNVGIVSFQPETEGWSVRHILAGELPPMADTGNTPEGLQPFIVHRFALSPLLPASWNDDRPRLVADGTWGVDTTEPAFSLLVDALPRIWQGAAEFTGRVWDDMPPVLDDVTREGLVADAASRASTPFRRRVVSELGPFSQLADAELDAVSPATVATLQHQVGRLDVDREARALVRPDIERLLALNQSLADPAAVFDDLLLLGCSEWVNERHRTISLISGLLATFRSPLFKQVPITHGLLGGLWDLWRNRTYADRFGTNPAAGLVSVLPRAFVFAGRLLLELLNHVIQDRDPRLGGGPPIFTPELLMAGVGAWQGMARSKRFTFVSGWEPRLTPVAPGTRAVERTAETIVRQTLSLLLHPGGRPQFAAPAQKFSVSMLPPPRDGEESKRHGSLYIGWDGALEGEIELGGGAIMRGEADGRGVHQFLWGGSRNIDARVNGALRLTILRPYTFELLPGVDATLTPAFGVTVGAKTGQGEGSYSPAFVIRLGLNDLEDRVRFKPDDDLLVQLLPTDGISLPFDAAVEWDLDRGYRFAGFGEALDPILVDAQAPQRVEPVRPPNADLDEPPFRTPSGSLVEVVTPLNKRLGVLAFHERRLEVLTASNTDGVSLTLSVTVTVSVNIGPVRIAVAGLGVNGVLKLLNQYEESDDLVDFSVSLAPPTALAVSIDSDAISGGGFLQRLPRPGGGTTWRGGLALRLGRRYDVAAWGVVETGGGRPWTLLAFLVIRFSPAIPLTAGLKLVAVGGLVALNRTMDTEALRDAATGTQGTLDPILFPDRPEQRFLELLPAVERFFPPAKGSQVIGLMAEIEWRADSGTRFGYFRLALLGELEKLQFGLYGTAQLGFPRLEDPHILRVRASLEALYDHRAKFARFSLTLTEAFLFERVHLTGGAAVLIRWGDRHEFAITLGGFHPSFRPFIPEGLREPPRLGANWKPHRLIEFDIKGYFALTSTSLQFGYSAHIEAGASWGGIRADTEMNFLVMTAPDCRFELDLSFRVTAYLFGADLISAGFSGSIKGPGPWVLEGSIYWEVCGVDLSKDLGPYEWGDRLSQGTQAQQARQVIGDGLADPANWTTRRSPRLPVRLRPGSDEALDPRDQIDIRQTRLPLGVALEMHDANRLSDRGTWTVRPASPGIAKLSDLTDVFPTRRYLQRPPKETPFKGGLASGTRIGGTGWGFNTQLAIVSDEEQTEDLVLDTLPAPPKRINLGIFVPLVDAVLVSLPAQSLERKWTRHTLTLEPRA